jgi:putative PEP-CTERM system histidine kinase
MPGELTTLALASGGALFGIGAIAYAVVSVLLMFSHPGTRQANWLVAGLIVSAVWCVSQIVFAMRARSLVAGLPVLDALHLATWVLFLASMLAGGARNSRLARTLSRLIAAGALTFGGIVIGQVWLLGADFSEPVASHPGLLAILALTLLGLLALEQIYRNAQEGQRPFLKWLTGGIGAVLVVAIFDYSQALLFHALTPSLWVISGGVNAAAAPLILLAIKRQPDWGRELYVSRQLAFYTTALVGAGLYLFAMGIVGFVLGTSDNDWGTPIQLAFLALAGAVFVYGVFSADVRRWARIFISRHFFRERYDYRDAWLRLSRALASDDTEAPLAERGLRALGEAISSPGGMLWLEDRESGRFVKVAAFGTASETAGGMDSTSGSEIAPDDEMVQFLRRAQWVVDSREYREDPGKYSNAFDADGFWMHRPSIVLPLIHGGRVVAIARLDRPALLGDLNFKDHDLLKTAGQQFAVFLMQQLAQEALAETRQFEAYSKLTAFLMHDLKNMISQQELIVGNARRFRDRPDFIDDAIGTMDSSVRRMRRLLERFRSMASAPQVSRIDLDLLIAQVCNECSDRQPAPVCTVSSVSSGLHVAMDREKLAMALTHAIRNAQDATSAGGSIHVKALERGGGAAIEIRDTGSGMDTAFIRDQLFKPFASTKGARGMGIGAYQMRETLRAAGGSIEVESVVGQGTAVRFLIPIDMRLAAGRKSVA